MFPDGFLGQSLTNTFEPQVPLQDAEILQSKRETNDQENATTLEVESDTSHADLPEGLKRNEMAANDDQEQSGLNKSSDSSFFDKFTNEPERCDEEQQQREQSNENRVIEKMARMTYNLETQEVIFRGDLNRDLPVNNQSTTEKILRQSSYCQPNNTGVFGGLYTVNNLNGCQIYNAYFMPGGDSAGQPRVPSSQPKQ